MLRNPFNSSAAVAAADALAKIVMDGVPVEVKDSGVKHAKKVSVSMRKMAQQIEWVKLQHKFNFFQKAKLGTAFKWKLKDAGYRDAYVNELTEWVMMRLK